MGAKVSSAPTRWNAIDLASAAPLSTLARDLIAGLKAGRKLTDRAGAWGWSDTPDDAPPVWEQTIRGLERRGLVEVVRVYGAGYSVARLTARGREVVAG